jgi:Flp pilus assembly protein TadG
MIAGALILLAVGLTLVDLTVLVLASSLNDSVAKNAARAAAGQQTQSGATGAAQRAVDAAGKSPIVASLELKSLDYDVGGDGLVKAQVRMGVRLPVPFPGWEVITFDAQAVEPLVAKR